MSTANIIYQGNLRTTSTHLRSGDKIITDAPVDNNGNGEAFSPTDLLSSSLGSCMLTIMGISASKNDINFNTASVSITKNMGTNPRRVCKIDVALNIEGNFTLNEKKILERAAVNCPVAKSLHPDIIQDVSFNYLN